MIMVTDVVYPGTWYVRLSTNQTPAERTFITAKLIDPFVWGVASDTDIPSTEIEDEQITDNSLPFTQMYDYYRTYEDIQLILYLYLHHLLSLFLLYSKNRRLSLLGHIFQNLQKNPASRYARKIQN